MISQNLPDSRCSGAHLSELKRPWASLENRAVSVILILSFFFFFLIVSVTAGARASGGGEAEGGGAEDAV